MIRIAVDAMGGDHAPASILKGADRFIRKQKSDKTYEIQLFGPQEVLERHLKKYPKLQAVSKIIHTDQVISNDMKPSQAVRQSKGSTMWKAIEAVQTGKADCIVSAGNTGALMALSKLILKTMPGVERPAIAAYMPTEVGMSVMLDLGANVQCDSRNLVQFAILGANFAQIGLNMTKPTIGLINVGQEENKGNDTLRSASQQLQNYKDLPGTFHGFIEGDQIMKGAVDVIVTDGFTGNVALKMAEGTVKLTAKMIERTVRSSLFAKIAFLLARGAFRQLRKRFDPRRYNGGLMLGLNGICVKSHGGADHIGFANAIMMAADLVDGKYLDKVNQDILAQD